MFFLGNSIGADEALRLNIVNRVVEPEELAKRGTKIGHPNECTGGGGALPCRLRAVPVTRA